MVVHEPAVLIGAPQPRYFSVDSPMVHGNSGTLFQAASWPAAVGVAAPALGDDFLAGKVDVVDGDAADQLDVVADEPAGAVQIELGLAGAQECGGACCGTSRQRSTLPDRCRWR